MSRPNDWQKVIDPVSETCVWVEPDGTEHPGTDAEVSLTEAMHYLFRRPEDWSRWTASY